MKFKAAGVVGVSLLSIGLVFGAIALKNVNSSYYSKGFATAHDPVKSLTITAEDISKAIGADTHGDFSAGGLNWHVEGASVADGVVTISQGNLYNVTLAGATRTADNWVGSGFTSVSIADYDSKTGAAALGFNSSLAQVFFSGMDAAAANPYAIDLATATDSVNRVQINFGAGAGTSFTSITYTYGCEEATPRISLGISRNSFAVGETATLTSTVKYVDGLSPVYSYASSNDGVASVVGNNLSGTVTGESAGTARITVTMTIEDVPYTSYVDVTVTAGALFLQWDKTPGGPLYIQGAGMIIAVDCKSIGYASNDSLNTHMGDVLVNFTGKTGASKVNFQKPDFAGTNGLYVTFPDADFSGITAIEVSVPHATTGDLHTATMEVTFSGSTPTISTLNGIDYATYMNS